MRQYIKCACIFLMSAAMLLCSACGMNGETSPTGSIQSETILQTASAESGATDQKTPETEDALILTVGKQAFQISLENNETVSTLKNLLPLNPELSELNGNEKYVYLDTKLPSAPQKVESIRAGDVMLYGDNCLVVFYESFDSSYSYTRIGHISDTAGLVEALGAGSIAVSFGLKKESTDANNVLIAYFSRTGNTEKISDYLAELSGADKYVIEAKEPYTDADIKYQDDSCRANKEQNDKTIRPEIAKAFNHMDDYDTILLGYPIWWGEEPRIIDTFLESYDFTDKTLIPFCTSGSSGITKSETNIKELVPIGKQIAGKRFSASSTKDEVAEWFNTLDIQRKETTYTVQDVRNLSDFLLTKPTTDNLTGKPYDLNLDQKWDAVDLGMMKRKILEQRGMKHEFDFESKTVLLNSGYEMPILGLGTWTQDDETAAESVYTALKDGYRLIDTAQYYGNETGVGNGLKKAIADGIVKREDVFITTKVMPSNYDRAYQSIDDSLKRLDVAYIDLMLIHQSGANDTEVYKALCQGVRDGKLRSIGISNYYTPEEFERVTAEESIKPAVVQNENHPFYQNTEFKEYVSKYGTVVESWYPFGGRGHTQDLFGNATIMEIAEAHGKTSAQIILRWHLQAGFVTIPGSQNPDHILENIGVFDFALTDSEMQRMADLHTGKRYENW